MKVFELSQTLRQQWLTADYAAKRRILEIVCLKCALLNGTLIPTIRKPFDVLAEGLVLKESPINKTAVEVFQLGIATWGAELRRQINGNHNQA